jgi:hypothetical protein
MKQFKFFQKNKTRVFTDYMDQMDDYFLGGIQPTRNRNDRRPGSSRREYNSFSYAGGEMNYIFIWLPNDTRRINEYRLGMYQGCIKDFGHTYDNTVIEDNEMLFLIPIIESIHIIRLDINVAIGSNYEFSDPNELVTIFYKIYITR